MILFEEIIKKAPSFDWKLWIYIEPHNTLEPYLKVLVLDADNEELGSDGFTPLEAEREGYVELLSIHDLQGILSHMKYDNTTGIYNTLEHITYYVENDAYLT